MPPLNANVIPFPRPDPQGSEESPATRLLPAPLGRRFAAAFIDFSILYGVFALAMLSVFPFDWLSDFNDPEVLKAVMDGDAILVYPEISLGALLVVCTSLLVFFQLYFVLFEWKHSTSPGKYAMGLRVLSSDGSPLTLKQALIRDAFRIIDCGLLLPGLASVLSSRHRERIGDRVAHSRVVRDLKLETGVHFLFLQEQHFSSLSQRSRPAAVPKATAVAFLGFAFPHYILEDKQPEPLRLEWDEVVRAYLPGFNHEDVSSEIRMRFFAELCLIALTPLRRRTELTPPASEMDQLKLLPYLTSPASLFRRTIAVFADGLILMSFQLPVQLAALYMDLEWIREATPLAFHPQVERAATHLMVMALGFPIAFLYYGWFYKNFGGTPGKLILGLRVLDGERGYRIGYFRTCLRETLGKLCSVLSLALFFIGLVLPIFHKRRRAVHDFIARTQVVYRRTL